MTYFFLLSLTFWTYALILSLWTFKPRSDYTYVAAVHPDTVMHWDTFHKIELHSHLNDVTPV